MASTDTVSDLGASGVSIEPDYTGRHAPFPLTDVQEAYWIGRHQSLVLGNVAAYIYFESEHESLDLRRFEAAWDRLIDRHDMLRAIILSDGQQQILEHAPRWSLAVHDLRALPQERIEHELVKIRQQLSHRILPQEQAKFSIAMSLLPTGVARLHVGIDLLVCDALSLQILQEELVTYYRDPAARLPGLELSFRDYVLAERRLRQSNDYQRAWEYWSTRRSEMPPPPALPLAVDPAKILHPRFGQLMGRVTPERWSRLKRRAMQARVTPTALLLALYADVLGLFSGQGYSTVNLTLFNRLPLHPQVDQIIGDFTSLLPLVIDNRTGGSFLERVRRIQQRLWEDLDNRAVSGVRIMREWARQGDNPLSAVLPVVFTSTLGVRQRRDEPQRLRRSPVAAPREALYVSNQTPQVWLDLQVSELGDGLSHVWSHVDKLFPQGMVSALFETFERQLERLDGGDWESELAPVVSATQLRQRSRINDTSEPLPDVRLEELFLARVAQRADAPAVIDGRLTVSYRELEARSAAIARRILDVVAPRSGTVAVVTQKGWEQVVGVIGVLRAGAAYVPVDPALPADRLTQTLAHTGANLALTQSWLDDRVRWPDGMQRIHIDSQPPARADELVPPLELRSDELAYVIYTSGSTGEPKGVMISHRGAVNTILHINRLGELTPADRVFSVSSLSFDLSVYDIFGVLAAGGTLVMPDPAPHPDPIHWLQRIEQTGVTVWNSVPVLLELLLAAAARGGTHIRSLRLALLSGDWIPLDLPARLRELSGPVAVLALGGATEASIWSIYKSVEEIRPGWKSIPYGRPLANQRFHVLNEALNPCPVWTPGELYIAGEGLALGYWRDEELTRHRFISSVSGERLYRTGDMGRYLPDGEIEFLGRNDTQVKILGQRVELGEIEAALAASSVVQQAVVTVHKSQAGRQRVIGYVVPRRTPEHDDCPDMQFSLFYFGENGSGATGENLYRLCLEGAKFADEHGLSAVWTPERHFTNVAAAYPNPAIMAAAVAMVTRRIRIRAGSVVLPLHNPIRVAEEWSVVDNLSGGRVDVSFAAGWVPDDFVFAPDGYRDRHARLLQSVDVVRKLWRGEPLESRNGLGHPTQVKTLPRPVQRELPIWLTCARSPSMFEAAGRLGANVLTSLLALNLEELRENIQIYRRTLESHGHDPLAGQVTVMLHTFVTDTDARARDIVREPLSEYFRAHEEMRERIVSRAGAAHRAGVDVETRIEVAIDRYLHGSALIGSVDSCFNTIRRLKSMGVNEIACLIDFGVDPDTMLTHLVHLKELAQRSRVIPDTDALRAWVRSRLPDHLVPTEIVTLDHLPLTLNGKVNRKALPAPTEDADELAYVAPRTRVEEILVEIWQEVLRVERVGIRDDFSELGGHSLSAMLMVPRVLDSLGVELPLGWLFELRTIEAIAPQLEELLAASSVVGES